MKKNIKFLFPAIYLIFVVLFFLLQKPTESPVLGYYFMAFCVLMIIVFGILAIKTYGLKNVHGKAILMLLIGQFLKMVWGLIFIMAIFNQNPLTIYSPENIIGLIGYVLMMIALIVEIKHCKINWTPNKILTNAALAIVIAGLVLYFGIYSPGLLGEDLTGVLSSIGDMILGIFAVMIFAIVREYQKGAMGKAWTLIMLGFLIGVLGNTLLANFAEEYFYQVWPFKNIAYIWYAGYILLAHGFYQMKAISDEASASLRQK